MKFLGRPLRQACALALLLAGMAVSAPLAAGGGYSDSNNYQYSIPGYRGTSGGSSTLFDASFNANSGFDLGCGGIGLFDFVKSTFNLNNIMEQFKGSMQTMLAKTVMTQLMSVPQLAAMFDTLNAFGNARFDMFQQSCDIGEIRKEAKQLCIDKCIAKGTAAETCRETECNNKGGMLAEVSSGLKKKIYEAENQNEYLRGTLCRDSGGAYDPKKKDSCFIMSLLPQVRLCLRSSIDENEKCPLDTYGVKDSPITVAAMRDTATGVAQAYSQQFDTFYDSAAYKAIADSYKRQAAREATTAFQNGESPKRSTTPKASTGDEKTDKLVKEFKDFIQCTDEDPYKLSLLYEEKLKELVTGASLPSIQPEPDIDATMAEFGAGMQGALKEVYGEDLRGLKEVIKIAVPCRMSRGGSISPNVRTLISSVNASSGESVKTALNDQLGYQVAIDVAQFTLNQLSAAKPRLIEEQQSRPALAQEGDTETESEYQETVESKDTEILTKAAKESLDTMIEKVKTYIANTEKDYKDRQVERRLLCTLAAEANGRDMDSGMRPSAMFCGL